MQEDHRVAACVEEVVVAAGAVRGLAVAAETVGEGSVVEGMAGDSDAEVCVEAAVTGTAHAVAAWAARVGVSAVT